MEKIEKWAKILLSLFLALILVFLLVFSMRTYLHSKKIEREINLMCYSDFFSNVWDTSHGMISTLKKFLDDGTLDAQSASWLNHSAITVAESLSRLKTFHHILYGDGESFEDYQHYEVLCSMISSLMFKGDLNNGKLKLPQDFVNMNLKEIITRVENVFKEYEYEAKVIREDETRKYTFLNSSFLKNFLGKLAYTLRPYKLTTE